MTLWSHRRKRSSTSAPSDDHHAIEIQRTTQVNGNENEDQDQNLISKTSDHMTDLGKLKSKFHRITMDLIGRAKSILLVDWMSTSSRGHASSKDSLRKAARWGDWKAAEEIEMKDPGILSRIISEDRNETALHIATRFNKVAFVKNLVTKLTQNDLALPNSYGNTALCIAATLGALDIAKSMVEKHKDLAFMGGSRNATTPVLIAARYRHKTMVDYLLRMTPIDFLPIEEQMELLVGAISADYYDIALAILDWNKSLALERDINKDTPLHIMARKSNTIASYNQKTKWQSYANNNSWFKYIYKKTTVQIKAHEMVANMWSTVRSGESSEETLMDLIKHPSSMLHEAARVGNVEFLEVLLHANPELLRIVDSNGKSIFHVAVENRQEGVFNLIYDMKLFNPDDLLYYFDEEKISLLELASNMADPSHLDRVSGAVFQMHSELLWFKVVENIVERTTRLRKRGEKTARELFTQKHRELKEEGEKWVKKTANSCMLVATLIATVVFAAAFTVPGGQNENIGSPIFLNHKWFTVFVISDGIALISSSTSILLFLSILTSRCAENDFLFWLPLELVCGLGFLFVSVISMVLAFGATFFLYYGKDTASLPLLITGMAVVPIFWFCVLQWKLWAHALVSLHATTVSCWLSNRKTSILKTITRGVLVH